LVKAADAYSKLADLVTAGYFDEDRIVAVGFVVNISQTIRNLFGSPMYGTVATIASVVLQREIKASVVREWCKGPFGPK